MTDNIIKIDTGQTYREDMARYSIYILYNRYVPDIRDGLKPVHRRILIAMFYDVKCVSKSTKRKSAATVGVVIGQYHPHGDSACYDSFKPLTNWFECKIPLICYDSNSGSIQGGPHSAMRYTESYMSPFAYDCVMGELKESEQVVDWQSTFDNHGKEPQSLPVKVPLLLVNGTFGIAIGSRIEVPKHSLNDVIDATLAVLDNPKAPVVLIPDPCMPCEIIDTNWKSISNLGFGNYIVRGIIETIHDKKKDVDILCIKSLPDLIWANSVVEKIEDLIKNNILIQIADIQDHSTSDQLDIRLILKKGSDANYVKQVLYKHTSIQDTKRVNMQVMNGTEINRISYKAYISYFLEYRRNIKFRLYNYRLQKVLTRMHQIEIYIKILESGDVENIIHMIRNNTSDTEDKLIDWLMKKLKITDLQAKFIIHTELGRLSKSNYNKYKEEFTKLSNMAEHFTQMIVNDQLIDDEIRKELIEIKAKYGRPRMSKIISEAEASDIPQGEFKIVITENNFVKKIQLDDPIRSYKGDNPKYVINADNSKDILLFDQLGKVFRLQTYKIAFTEKNSPGIDIRLLLKKLTSNIICVMYLPTIEELNNKSSKNYLITVTKNGLSKRMDLADIINATPSGIIYSKLAEGDLIKDIIISNHKSDVVIYTKAKALRIPVNALPYLKRSTMGNQTIKSKYEVDGISVINQETTDIVVVTAKGKFNRFSSAALPQGNRNQTGNKVINLVKGDYIKNVFSCSNKHIIRVTTLDEVLEFSLNDIPVGSSISSGTKLCKEVLKCELVRKQ